MNEKVFVSSQQKIYVQVKNTLNQTHPLPQTIIPILRCRLQPIYNNYTHIYMHKQDNQKKNRYRHIEFAPPPSRRGCETDLHLDKCLGSSYNPFHSPNIISSFAQRQASDQLFTDKSCNKALFEDDDEQTADAEEVSMSRAKTPLGVSRNQNQSNLPARSGFGWSSAGFTKNNNQSYDNNNNNKNVQQAAAKHFIGFPEKSQKPNPTAARGSNKQNSTAEEEAFSFNTKQRVRYPETPGFKRILQSPLPKFMAQYSSKMQDLKASTKKKVSIVPLEYDKANPTAYYKEYGYKYFMCLAEGMKKSMAYTECRAMYKIALHLQPYDDTIWEWAIKLEEELGYLQIAFTLSKTALLFVATESLALKFIKLAERTDKPIEDIRGVVNYLGGKPDKYSKVYYELAKLQWKVGSKEVAFKVFYFLTKTAENSLNYVQDLAKILECEGMVDRAIHLLYTALEKNIKIYNVYSYYLKLVQQQYPNLIWQNIQYLLSKADENLPLEVRWKVQIEVAQVYFRYGQLARFQKHMKNALEMAPANNKWRPYLCILKQLKSIPPVVKNSVFVAEGNKLRLLLNVEPVLHSFNEWKHYLHYSLFYLLHGSEEAKKLLEEAASRWSYAGRLWAEVLWVQRARVQSGQAESLLSKWQKIVMEVPKSGQVWCQGGRIYSSYGDYKKALFCFEAAMHLTPQYGDSFIEALKVYMILDKQTEIKRLRQRVLAAEPFYGNLWCFMKPQSRSSIIDVWQNAKSELQKDLHTYNLEYFELKRSPDDPGKIDRDECGGLTAIRCYNRLFARGAVVPQAEKEKIISAYDQLDNNKN